MTVYYMGTEYEDFVHGGTIGVSTTAADRRTANTRLALVTGGATEDTNYLDSEPFSATNFWTRATLTGSASASATNNLIKWYSGGTHKLGFHWSSPTGGTVALRQNTGSWISLGTATDSNLLPFSSSTTYDLCFYIKVGNPGEFRVYINNIPVISLNALDLSAITSIDKVRVQSPATSAISANWSEVIVASWCTLGAKVVQRPPTGNGSYQEFTNGAFGIVDETIATGADLAVSGTVGQRTTYTHAAFTALLANEAIAAAKVSASLNRDAAGPQNFNFMTRIGSTDYNDSDQTLNTTLTKRTKMWENSPATAVPWTIAELNAAHMGIRSRT